MHEHCWTSVDPVDIGNREANKQTRSVVTPLDHTNNDFALTWMRQKKISQADQTTAAYYFALRRDCD